MRTDDLSGGSLKALLLLLLIAANVLVALPHDRGWARKALDISPATRTTTDALERGKLPAAAPKTARAARAPGQPES